MALALSGYFNLGGQSTQYEYRYAVVNRSDVTAHVRLELRLKPSGDIVGQLTHYVMAYGGSMDGSATSWNTAVGSGNIPGGSWSGWYTVFDTNVTISIDEYMVYFCPGIGIAPYDFQEENGALNDGINIGQYPRPSTSRIATVTPLSINVANQDFASVQVAWSSAEGAASYRLVMNTQMNITGIKTVGNYATASHMFNPKQAWYGVGWQQNEIMDGTKFYFGVEPVNASGVSAGEITWAGPLSYVEDATYAPSNCFMVGWNAVRNEVVHWGEEGVRVYVSDWVDGSYPVSRFELVRSDGYKVEWGVDDMLSDSIGRYVVKDVPGWQGANESVQFELRVYDAAGHPAYAESGTWPKFSVKYYGGTMSVYGKGEWLNSDYDYLNNHDAEEWRRGLAYVYDGTRWRRAMAVYVYTGTGWETL